MIYQLSALWLLLSAAAAAELYDELPEDNDILFQENDIDAGPAPEPGAEESQAARLQDLLLFRLIGAQLRREIQDTRRRSHKQPDLGSADNSLEKRAGPERARPQRWWKTKKGRGVGNQMCYFKLCAFRNPA